MRHGSGYIRRSRNRNHIEAHANSRVVERALWTDWRKQEERRGSPALGGKEAFVSE